MFSIPAKAPMDALRLSIILPAYNVEPYIERCVRSLLDQNIPLSEYEIIVVNDGSPDNSKEVVARLMQEADNIRLIDQSNMGVSKARNTGVDQAQGKYVLFIDPDDFVLSNSLSSALQLAETSQAQVAFLGYQIVDIRGSVVTERLYLDDCRKLYTGIEAYPLFRGDGKCDPDRSVGILYKRSFLDDHKIRYLENVPYLEDGEFVARVMCQAQACTFTGESFYVRTTRPGSATTSGLFNTPLAMQGFLRAAANLKGFQQQLKAVDQARFINQPIAKYALLSIQACASRKGVWYFRSVLKGLRESELRKLKLEGCKQPYVNYGSIYNISPVLFFIYYALRMLGNKIGFIGRDFTVWVTTL